MVSSTMDEKFKRRQKYYRKNKKFESDRVIRKLYSEQGELYHIKYRSEPVELEKPYQDGFEKHFILREDASRRQDADILKIILKQINNSIYSKDGLFLTFKSYGSKVKVPQELKVRGTNKDKLEKLEWPENYKKYFYFLDGYYRTSKYGKIWHPPCYYFRYPYFFTTEVRKLMVTHSYPIFPEVESRLKELSYMLKHKLLNRLDNLKGNKVRYRYDDRGDIRKPELKNSRQYIEEYEDDLYENWAEFFDAECQDWEMVDRKNEYERECLEFYHKNQKTCHN